MGARVISCRLPDYGWAWPSGSLHQLLTAALLPNGRASLAAAWQWLDQNEIERTGFREQRLLVAISARFGKELGPHPSYPKLIGLRRRLWTQSRLAVREAEPALRAMSEAGTRILLIKGAARIARDPGMEGTRISHDVDVAVGPRDFGRAFDLLHCLGWQAASGASAQRIASEISSMASINCFFGASGDIDLHRETFPSIRDARDEERIWDNAEESGFHGIPVLVPSRSDQAALAIAHGCFAAHIHSDWLVDCVDAFSSMGFLVGRFPIDSDNSAAVRRGNHCSLLSRWQVVDCHPLRGTRPLDRKGRSEQLRREAWRSPAGKAAERHGYPPPCRALGGEEAPDAK